MDTLPGRSTREGNVFTFLLVLQGEGRKGVLQPGPGYGTHVSLPPCPPSQDQDKATLTCPTLSHPPSQDRDRVPLPYPQPIPNGQDHDREYPCSLPRPHLITQAWTPCRIYCGHDTVRGVRHVRFHAGGLSCSNLNCVIDLNLT